MLNHPNVVKLLYYYFSRSKVDETRLNLLFEHHPTTACTVFDTIARLAGEGGVWPEEEVRLYRWQPGWHTCTGWESCTGEAHNKTFKIGSRVVKFTSTLAVSCTET